MYEVSCLCIVYNLTSAQEEKGLSPFEVVLVLIKIRTDTFCPVWNLAGMTFSITEFNYRKLQKSMGR